MSALHKTARRLASKGMRVFPCNPGSKFPATPLGVLDATTDPTAIDTWWQKSPDYNVAVATGAPSGIFVVDIDGLEAETELRKLEAEHAPLPTTVETITSRGRHIWLRMPDAALRNSAGKIAPHVDVRATGGYILCPPSLHPSGKRYAWSVDSANAIAEAPPWLLAKVVEPAGGNGAATAPSEWVKLATEGVIEGARNDSVTRLTGHLLRRYVDPRVTLELIRVWNAMRCRPPLDDREVEGIVNSIAGKELKRRQEAGRE
jgi:hypothetical protein